MRDEYDVSFSTVGNNQDGYTSYALAASGAKEYANTETDVIVVQAVAAFGFLRLASKMFAGLGKAPHKNTRRLAATRRRRKG